MNFNLLKQHLENISNEEFEETWNKLEEFLNSPTIENYLNMKYTARISTTTGIMKVEVSTDDKSEISPSVTS